MPADALPPRPPCVEEIAEAGALMVGASHKLALGRVTRRRSTCSPWTKAWSISPSSTISRFPENGQIDKGALEAVGDC